MKRMNNTSFQGLENQKTFGKLLAQGRTRRSSKRLRNQCGKIAVKEQGLETRKLLAKDEEEEEVQRDVQKLFKMQVKVLLL